MDRKHKLEAPNNESLKTIEQLGDRSELSTLYRTSRDQWDGELVSPEEREHRRQKKQESLSFGIRRQFWLVGLIAPLPLVLFSLFIGFIFAVFTEDNAPLLVIPMMILFLLWGVVSLILLRKTFELFYQHGLRALPYIVTLVILLALSIQSIYLITIPMHGQGIMSSVLLVSAIELLWSIILSYALIILWTTPRLSGGAKMGIITIFSTILLAMAVALTLVAMQ